MAAFLTQLDVFIDRDFLFWFCAISGSLVLIVQLVLALLGITGHDDFSDMDSGDVKWLSKQTIFSFLTMFGWMGLACRKEYNLSFIFSFLLAFIAGTIAVFVVSYIFKIASKLRSSGTVFRIEDAVGKEAVVYQKISLKGSGKVTVCLDNFTHEIEAVSDEEIPSFAPVKIIKKVDDKTVFVVPRGKI